MGFWKGPTDCCGPVVDLGNAGDLLQHLDTVKVVRCDEVQWRFLGLSLAGYNVLISLLMAAIAAWGFLRTSSVRSSAVLSKATFRVAKRMARARRLAICGSMWAQRSRLAHYDRSSARLRRLIVHVVLRPAEQMHDARRRDR